LPALGRRFSHDFIEFESVTFDYSFYDCSWFI
jgi:hypothetical protein